jgi:uncharacterized membrane protein
MKLLKRNWLNIFLVFYGIFVLLPLLAPVLMKSNLPGLGKAIYVVYSFVCHQLPQRSLFFFGPKLMYSFGEIQAAWQRTQDPLILRQFTGNAEMGWKVAWSDRMISMYGGVWLAGLFWGMLRKYNQKISTRIFIVLAFPMVLDGFSHLISDFGGLINGFRYTNDWLAILTQNYFPASFYMGDALGSFNSWVRWLSGILFGFGLVWWAFPYISENLDQSTQTGFDLVEQH